jgi:hypothetical protein
MESWTWDQVWRRRLARHQLLEPAPIERLTWVVGQVCGIHCQVATSAELSIGLRVNGATRHHVRRALWDERSLIKTYGLRGTVQLFPAAELSLWLAALRARPPLCFVVTVDPIQPLEPRQREQVAEQARRVGEILESSVEVSFGHVEARAHL